MINLLNFLKGLDISGAVIQHRERNAHDVDEYVERVIEGIDPRLRLVSGYKRKLHDQVFLSLSHINNLVDQIPGPIKVSRKTFISDPGVRAYFASPDALQEIFNRATELKSYFAAKEHAEQEECCAMLCANKEEKKTMGIDLKDDILRHDIIQTSINFIDHKVLSPATAEDQVRKGIKMCIFDGLITYALQHIASIKIRRRDLRNEHRILHAKLRARQANGNGLSTMLAEAGSVKDDAAEIKVQLSETENELYEMLGKKDVFAFYLDEIRKIFAQPEDFIRLNAASFRLTDMGIKVEDNAPQAVNTVCFSELEIIHVLKRVVTIIRYYRDDLNFNKQALS